MVGRTSASREQGSTEPDRPWRRLARVRRIVLAREPLGGDRSAGIEADDAPALEVLVDEKKPGQGTEQEEGEVPYAPCPPQGEPGDESEEDVIGEIAQELLGDLSGRAAQTAADLGREGEIGRIGRRRAP